MSELPVLRARASAIGLAYVVTALVGLALAVPIGALVGTTWPEGDARIFAPGGLVLLETVRLLHREAFASALSAPWAFLAWSLVPLVPWGTVLVALARRREGRLVDDVAGAIAIFPSLLLVFGVGLVARGVAIAGGAVVATALSSTGRSERGDTYGFLVGIVVGLLLHGLARVAVDLASATVAVRRGNGLRALLDGVLLVRAERFLAWLWRGLLSFAVVLLAAWVATVLDAAKPSHAVVIAVVHQLALAAIVVLRASWLRVAVRAAASRIPAAALDRQPMTVR